MRVLRDRLFRKLNWGYLHNSNPNFSHTFPFLRNNLGVGGSLEFSPGGSSSWGSLQFHLIPQPPESMDSLLFLCARCIIAQRHLPALPAGLYPILFKVAFLDRKPLVLRDLVVNWPFPVLHFQQLVGHQELLRDHDCNLCVEAIIEAMVAQLRQELEEPGHHSSLRMLDVTGLSDSVCGRTRGGLNIWFRTDLLAKACVEVSKHQRKFPWLRSKQHKGRSRAATAAATPQPPGVDIYADLVVKRRSYGILRDALQAGAAGPLRLKCREFQAKYISASKIMTLLESLDPSCLRRVDLRFNNLGLTGLSEILRNLSRFPELRSLKLRDNNVDVRHPTPESAIGIRCVARQLGMLPKLRELNLGSTHDLQAPLESLELGSCSLVPVDLTFLSQSFHAPALKRLDLSGHDFSQGLLEPLRLLLEETSASLLHLILMGCYMADSHLKALLPTLLRCSRLRFLALCGNPLSMAALKDLLQKTLELPDLHLVVYPYPRDCYNREPSRFGCNFEVVVDEVLLVAATAEISQLLANSGRTDLVWSYNPYGHGALDYFSL
ncbi:hypothetical protein IHE44_0001336 [Lamprotornis superbus]|uniref:Leucine-rich repeat-containing protein 14 n=1 Tax=Lamprotornis superbus TaxID=245042 RepID=A0A835NDX2_9PASS|nr:hypothetical protein IHE44_0001336 [Lamprotornis superbus]